jgi:uncharacterized protein
MTDRSYQPRNPLLRFPHLSTVLPALFGRSEHNDFARDSISLIDGELITVDWLCSGSEKLLIVLPGLEGHSRRVYMTATAHSLSNAGWDVLLLNHRGTEGGTLTRPRTYHGGAIEDLRDVIDYVCNNHPHYKKIAACGFSLGGNITLNYLGNPDIERPAKLVAGIGISVPCDFTGAAQVINRGLPHLIYGTRFLRELKSRVRQHRSIYEQQIDCEPALNSRTLYEFDDRFTGPLNGFGDADKYYRRVSCLQYISNIEVPTLLVNARNDPLLSESCFPFEHAEKNTYFQFEAPRSGGHVGFSHNISFSAFYYVDRICGWLENH